MKSITKITTSILLMLALQGCSTQQLVRNTVSVAKLPVKAAGAVAGKAGGAMGGAVAGNTGRRIGNVAGQQAARRAIY